MTTITSTDLRNKSIGLYIPPFRFEHGYIWDAKGQMVADNLVNGEDAALRVRGWGRISYMENPEALQDEVGNVIALAMTEFWERCVSDKAEPIYQVQYGNDWRDAERAQYDDHAAHGSPVRVVYAAPPAPVVPEELLSAMEEVLRISDRDHEAWHKARNGIVSCRAATLQGQPVSNRDELREQVRREHAEWSDATFGDVGPVGPLKHLSKEALEAAVNPEDSLEWADMQLLLWDAQRLSLIHI